VRKRGAKPVLVILHQNAGVTGAMRRLGRWSRSGQSTWPSSGAGP
jgi:hypothetical protein